MGDNLQVNDPVHVAAAAASGGSSSPLEGVVCFIGSVPGFFSGSGSDSDMVVIGVRLTGASVGLGDASSTGSSGIYQGTKYFDCPPKSGVFCLPNAVTKRHLTRLEELRLRRELSSTAAPTTAAGGAAVSTPPRKAASTTSTTGLKPPSPSTASVPSSQVDRTTTATATTSTTTASAVVSTPTSASSAAATRSKLDELRARRAALQKKDDSADTIPTTTTTTAIPRSAAPAPAAGASSPPAAAAVAASSTTTSSSETRVIEELHGQLSERTNQMNDLKTALERSQQQAQQALAKVAQLEKDAAAKPTSSSTSTTTLDSASKKQQQEELMMAQRDLQQEKQAHAETQRRLKQVEEEAKAHAAAAAPTQASPSSASQQQHQQWSSAQASEAYKERARLQAEIAALHRAAAAWDAERVELESTLEDVTLDKEQLQEEKENLEDKLEECKLDVETAQMECEELRLQVEDVRRHYAEQQQQQHQHMAAAALETSGNDESRDQGDVGGQQGTANNDAAEEKIRALSVQNGRLREALIRLREQTAFEKMQMHKDLRTAEKEMEPAKAIQTENVQLKQAKSTLEEQVNDLKDMVEQGAAFEGMVEDLSDRVMSMEEFVMTLQGTIREMEEAAELTAEMEEVQTEEIKALYRDMEGRDSIIRNMEEAIKMQRRREDDYRRTVGNYRTTVDTLRQERQALLELQQGEHGEKTTWMAASQKALARAAQLVTDAAASRKREARAAMVSMESQVYKHLSVRLERLLPKPTNVSREISAVKGELITSKVAGKASKTLEGIAESFGKNIKPPLPPAPEDPTKTRAASTDEGDVEATDWELSDELRQEVTTMLHQTEFSHVLIDASAELRRLLAAGQWPDLLTPDVSLELGSILGHGIGQLDSMLTVILKSLKEEGTLTQEQSNIGALRQAIQTTMQALRADIEREDSTLVPASWNPAGWQLLKDASIARFSCMGSTAALSLALHANEAQPPAKLFTLYGKLEQTSTQATSVCLRLANLDVQNTQLVNNLSACMVQWKKEASEVMDCVHKLVLSSAPSSAENVEACELAVAKTLKALAVLSHSLRGAGLNPTEDERVHALSPEADDAWERLTDIVRSIRGIDGDEEDVNYLIRAHDIEVGLQQAVENQPKLAQAEAKLATLEKILSSRSKEISMQNAKMSELEKHLAKSSTGALGRSHTSDLKSVEEYNSLKEENRVLIEAMDVMSRQVDEYENEIRILKDFKSPKRGAGGGRTPRRSVSSIGAMGDLGSPAHSRGGAVDEATLATVGALEATLFRPALQAALRDVARWKSEATVQAIMHLPPLPCAEEYKLDDRDADDLMQLESALSLYRLEKASTRLVDLKHPTKSPRVQLRELKARDRMASENLESVFLRCRGRLYG
jgi:dynactin 1